MNVRRLAMNVLVSLVLPLTILILVDFALGWTPLLTIVASVIFIPLSSIIVIRATLSELDRVIQAVAPVELDSQE
jgi:hypothetical protein